MALNLCISDSNCLQLQLPSKSFLERLKNLREQMNGKLERRFFFELHILARDWKGKRPNLRDIFEPREIESILKDCISEYDDERARIIEFVASSGYRYEPEIDQAGGQQQQPQQQLLLRRATPIHYAAMLKTDRLNFLKKRLVIEELFKIYDRFDVNYANGSGYTHFHAAVVFNLVDVVKKFLDAGQDSNLCVETTGDSPLFLALATGNLELIELLLRRGADPNRANKRGSTPLHVVGKHFKDAASRDVARMLFELSDVRHRPLRVDAQDKLGNTPLYRAVKCVASHKSLMEFLLRNGADSNVANKKGETPLYIICRRSTGAVLPQLFFKINDELNRAVHIDAQDKSGDAALHAVVRRENKKAWELLLRRGANPNLANEEGHTALHLLCKLRGHNDEYKRTILNMFFSINDETHRFVQIDARDKSGNTPLHLASIFGNRAAIDILLRRGANPNLVNEAGEAPLHVLCKWERDGGTIDWFLELMKENQQTVPIDVQDHFGNTPLHLALEHCNQTIVVSLLRRGANPNLADSNGSTSLHIICRTRWYFDKVPLVKSFFRISDEMGQSMLIDVRDKSGRTPLERAVERICPSMVDLFLERGADLSSFVFPTESHFDELFQLTDRNWHILGLASGILWIVEDLEKRGYELDRDDALSLMKVLVQYSSDSNDLVEGRLNKHEDELKQVKVNPSLSLYDLIRLESTEASKLASCSDYFKLQSGDVPIGLFCFFQGGLAKHLCEKVSRKFFIDWALEPFWELTHGRLPLNCCEMIVRNMSNKDLLNVCLAAAGQSHKESEYKKRKLDAAFVISVGSRTGTSIRLHR